MLDTDDDVIVCEAEPFVIEYVLDGVTRRYVPDFLMTLRNGRRRLVEVKPRALLNLPINIAKMEAALRWCEQNDAV